MGGERTNRQEVNGPTGRRLTRQQVWEVNGPTCEVRRMATSSMRFTGREFMSALNSCVTNSQTKTNTQLSKMTKWECEGSTHAACLLRHARPMAMLDLVKDNWATPPPPPKKTIRRCSACQAAHWDMGAQLTKLCDVVHSSCCRCVHLHIEDQQQLRARHPMHEI